MKIMLDESVKNYLKKKKKIAITLNLLRSGGGWCGVIEIPEVNLGAPEEHNMFNKYKVDGVEVYIQKNIKTIKPIITFKARKTLFVTSLYVEGLKLKSI